MRKHFGNRRKETEDPNPANGLQEKQFQDIWNESTGPRRAVSLSTQNATDQSTNEEKQIQNKIQ